MTEYKINAQLFKDMIITSANCMEQNKQRLNDLNVFPVPDGDTGTNMLLTLVSAAKEVNGCEPVSVGKIAAALSNGALKGARGNSGVILSQIFRGFAKSIPVEQEFLHAIDFANAMEMGVQTAYKAVMRPKEGTILTVAKAMAASARKSVNKGYNSIRILDKAIEDGIAMLKRTPEMLPVLKQAGVVDAGGAGLIVIFQGFKMAIDGEEVISDLDLSAPKSMPIIDDHSGEIEFGYCTEFFIKNPPTEITESDMDRLKEKLNALGDSLVVVGDETMLKVHVHTDNPGKALQMGLAYGELSGIKVDNMREQHRENVQSVAKKPVALCSVSAGDGLRDIIKELGVDGIVEGGQSMNPSAEDIANVVESLNAECVIVMPNNKNIILAAEQAAHLTKTRLEVIPSKSFPQGLNAVLAYREDVTLEDNISNMTEALSEVKTAQVTTAVRDSSMNGHAIKEGEYIGIIEGDIVAHNEDISATFEELLIQSVDDDSGVVSIYYGDNIEKSDAESLAGVAEDLFDDCDIELYYGGQSVYDYIISVE